MAYRGMPPPPPPPEEPPPPTPWKLLAILVVVVVGSIAVFVVGQAKTREKELANRQAYEREMAIEHARLDAELREQRKQELQQAQQDARRMRGAPAVGPSGAPPRPHVVP
jgi:hypothetical protein